MAKHTIPEWTPERMEYRQLFLTARDKMKRGQEQMLELQKNCQHMIYKTLSNGAKCQLCETHFGHYCRASPDRACHYYTNEHNKVSLLNGKFVSPPAEHDAELESDDFCMYCGEPHDRK